ncbi:MAG: ABC transporter ATP-binding protein [Bacteriovorax sp.]|nr:ABC transporter ATP-binding protein [Bacteriovorax sp.]
MKTNILEIENLTIGFKQAIFEKISAEVYAGTITALMGVNGAGKSCLLKTIANLIPALEGLIRLHGKDHRTYSSIDFAKVVSIVLTEKLQVDFLRVDELIYLGRSPYTNWMGEIEDTDREVVNRVMDQIGLCELASSFFSELSDGQKQKVLIARALAQKPKLLILDEPTTYLDIPSKIELIKLLKKISTENKVAILMSTHDLELIESNVDQIWLMGKDGSFNEGSPAHFRSTGLFEKHFYSGLS